MKNRVQSGGNPQPNVAYIQDFQVLFCSVSMLSKIFSTVVSFPLSQLKNADKEILYPPLQPVHASAPT